MSNKYPIVLTFRKKKQMPDETTEGIEITTSQIPRRTLEEFARMTAKGGVWTPPKKSPEVGSTAERSDGRHVSRRGPDLYKSGEDGRKEGSNR